MWTMIRVASKSYWTRDCRPYLSNYPVTHGQTVTIALPVSLSEANILLRVQDVLGEDHLL